MTWNFAYTPHIWLSVLAILLFIALAVYAWRRRSVPGALPFSYALLFGALWVAGAALEYPAVDLADKITWVKFQAAWQVPTATAVTCFLLEYAWPGRWLTRRNLALLSIIPLLIILFILTDHLHHLFWSGFAFTRTVTPLLGPVGWIAVAYGYSFVIVNFVVFAWLFLRSPQHRWFVVLILTGQFGIRFVYLLERTLVLQSGLPLEMFGLTFAYLMYSVALFRYHVLDPNPLANQAVIAQMREGMLVLDTDGRVANLNPAAERILQIPAKMVKWRAVRDLLPVYLEGMPETPEETEIEFTLGAEQGHSGSPVRYYTLAVSPLKDWRGIDAGSLLLLHDITSRKQAEAALNRSQEIQRMIYEKSFDGISIYEEIPYQGRRILVDCNERYCQMAGRSKEELLAIQDTRVIQEAEDMSVEYDRAAVITETAFSGVFSWIRPDGKQNLIEYNAAPIRVGDRFYTIGVDRDITESRQTQAQTLEQQRIVATLSERERLARELHDSLGQVLGFASLKLGATRKLVTDGKLEKADDQMAHLESILSDAHADVREYILNLHTAPRNDQHFLATVRHYLDGFRQNYGIQVLLNVDEGLGQSPFPPQAQVQVFRILQEALSNARKHGKARCVQVSFTTEGNLIRIAIQDDGQGFDVTQPAGDGHYGLRFIRERAEGLSGRLSIDSAPGQGTRLTLEVPLDHTQGS